MILQCLSYCNHYLFALLYYVQCTYFKKIQFKFNDCTFDESYVECLLSCKLHMHLSVYCKLLQLRCGGRQSFCYINISLMAACPYFCQRSLVSLARGMFFSCSLLNLGANLSVMGLESVNVWH